MTYNTALKQRFVDHNNLLFLVPVSKAHQLRIVPGGIDATHQPLVITKEEDRNTRDKADCVEERALVELVCHIVFGQRLAKICHGWRDQMVQALA